MQIKLLKEVSHHLLSGFHCGNESIDTYFQSQAVSDDDAVTYCFLDDDLKTIIALSSLSCNGIIVTSSKMIYTYPAVEIKMFAVNETFKHQCVPGGDGMHWSDYCFNITIAKIYEFTEKYCGASRMFLYAVPQAYNFYVRQGMRPFTDLLHGDDRMYLDGCIPMYMHL